MKPTWKVIKPNGARLVMTDGACAWSRRADAINAAEVKTGEDWPDLKAAGWSVETPG